MAIRESTDRRRLRGMRTRQAILVHAARVGSAEGLEAVSLQRLAGDLGISKSGLFAHFGSKEELHMATIEAAAQIFTDEVLRPALQVPRGLGRVWALCNSWLSYSSGASSQAVVFSGRWRRSSTAAGRGPSAIQCWRKRTTGRTACSGPSAKPRQQ